jgi:uncharacterized membrane protein required for colicin V production
MGNLFVLLVIAGCAAYQYFKGTFVKSYAAVITFICASVVAFGYFELLANVMIGREILVPWAACLSFVVLFILAFAILQTVASLLTHLPVDLGFLPERIGRVVFGILLGLVVSGLLLTAAAMAPISAKYPYQRFDTTNPDPENPSGVLLNADGFAAGWFSVISSGSFSGKRSFAVLHPGFLNQLFLNRHEIDNGASIISVPEAISIPPKAVWQAPEDLKDMGGQPLQPKSGHNLTIVRMELSSGAFTLSQLRVICKQKDDKGPFAGKGQNIYSVGYMEAGNRLQMKKLTDRIEINGLKKIDFAFYVPDGFVPVLAEFKQNNVVELPAPAAADQVYDAVPFTPAPPPAALESAVRTNTASPAAANQPRDANNPNSLK